MFLYIAWVVDVHFVRTDSHNEALRTLISDGFDGYDLVLPY